MQKNLSSLKHPNVVPNMETSSGPQQSKLWADVEEELKRVLPLHESLWVAEAPDLKNETLVALIRHIREGNRTIYDCLLEELMRRIVRLVKHWVAVIRDETSRDYVASHAEFEVLKLVLTTTATKTSHYLEVAFAKKVRQTTFDEIRKYRKSPSGRRGQVVVVADPEDNLDEIDGLSELVPSRERSPETITLHADLMQAIRDRVEDPRHFDAAMLHWGHGWPVSCKDPEQDTLVRYFGVPERQIDYWLKKVRAIILSVLNGDRS